ncbi:mechanosensitive ion channel family protein [Corynebacterium ureicelerivorans]|uniref:mechanosensitive ion channel family protein n=1 Tax=Corynebacterium ureicelerivorans TaxID=401472 RepID=UPI0006900660|nr:mechanosensitive ion channel family protein [Corynebacterium ureicelerivorans]MDN8606173.1 mechanosensitive ion channel family protein [Corynebacterium ureicelerivorans]
MNAQSETAEKVDEAVTGVTSWWNDPETQDILIQRPLKILLIIVVALVLNWLARSIIHRATRRGIERTPLLASEAEDTPQYRAQEARRQQRMRTLGNVGRSVAVIVIWTWAALAVLDQLGVNVAPLIASAGVVGVAIGFGAQSLVKDFFSGMFILIENQFGVGDTIQVGDIVGEVEMMTLRITTIRDMDGALWHVRNGDIDQVGNHSARFSTARLQIPVSLMADPDKVSRVIEDTAIAACRDPEIRDVVMGTPAMLGPSEFNPTYVSFRLTVQTMPGQQWAVARHLNHRVLAALHQEDVVLTAMDSVLVEMKENRGDQS